MLSVVRHILSPESRKSIPFGTTSPSMVRRVGVPTSENVAPFVMTSVVAHVLFEAVVSVPPLTIVLETLQ